MSFDPKNGKKGVVLDTLWSHLHFQSAFKAKGSRMWRLLQFWVRSISGRGGPSCSTDGHVLAQTPDPSLQVPKQLSSSQEVRHRPPEISLSLSLPSSFSLKKFPRFSLFYRSSGKMLSYLWGRPTCLPEKYCKNLYFNYNIFVNCSWKTSLSQWLGMKEKWWEFF